MTTKTPNADVVASLQKYLNEIPEVLNEYKLTGFMVVLNLQKGEKTDYYMAVNGSPLRLVEAMADGFKQHGKEIELPHVHKDRGTLH